MRRLERADIGAAVATLGAAFFEDSLVGRLCPDEGTRLYRTEPVFSFSANMAVGYGEAWAVPQATRDGDATSVAIGTLPVVATGNEPGCRAEQHPQGAARHRPPDGGRQPHAFLAVALWQYSWRMGCPLWRWVQYGALDVRRRLGAPAYRELTSVSARIDAMRERVAPERYLYLSSLGVAPQHRRAGLARALVLPRVRQAAAEGLSSIVETNDDGALAFYRHVGFVVRAQSTIAGLRYTVLEYPAGNAPAHSRSFP